MENALLEAALSYARRGWHVFPIHWPANGKCSCGKTDCGPQAKHPLTQHGLNDATTDPKIISEWWAKWPSANIGIATGAVSGIVVVDIDNPEAKEEIKKIWPSDYNINLVARSVTGRGWHLVFAHPGGEIKNRSGILPKVDVRGDGGYFIVEPSTHISGKQYKWQVPPADELRKLPVELYRLITSGSNHNSSGDHERFDSSIVWEGIPEGRRDHELFRYACQLRSFNAPREVADRLIIEAAALCWPPFPDRDALKKVEQAYKYPAGYSNGNGHGDNSLNSLSSQQQLATKPVRPILEAEALYGLAGDFIKTIEPYTEADPVAILITFLLSFGNVIGRSAHFTVEETKHYLNLFAVLVGLSSKGRKGLSGSTAGYIFSRVDSEWSKQRKKSGLSSGEGLINELRDERYEERPVKEHGRVTDYDRVRVDEGVADKRLLVFEEEFSQGLKTMVREGNILSPIIRQAWDTGSLSPMTKHTPIKATGAHISILGHITRDELLRHLTETEQCNGYGNRFLWFVVERSKKISNPIGTPKSQLDPLIDRLCAAADFAKTVNHMKRDGEAEAVWSEVYNILSEGSDGLVGAITSRGEAQTMRLACLYALLDQSSDVRVEHLNAALALWAYSENCARSIFGTLSGDPVADRILAALTQAAHTETQLHGIFGRHRSADEIDRALVALQSSGKIACTVESTGGRPLNTWRLCEESEKSEKSPVPRADNNLSSLNSLNSHGSETA